MGLTQKSMLNWARICASNLRNIFGSSWGRECEIKIGVYSRIRSNIFTMILWDPSDSEFSSNPSASVRCTTYQITRLNFWWQAWVLSQLVRTSVTNNSLRTIFALQLRADYPHPSRTSWRIIMRNIVPYFMNNGVNFCPPLRLRIIEKGLQPR